MKPTAKYILILFSYLILMGSLQAQNKKIDSLKSELALNKPADTTRINLLYELAFLNFQSDLEATKLYLAEAEDLSDQLNYVKGKAKVQYLKGILESRKSNYATSLTFFKRSLKLYESIQDRSGIAAVYTAFGITHFVQSEYDEALASYKKASDIFTDLGAELELISSLIRIANVYTETGRYPEAISNYNKALTQYELIDDEEGIAYVHGNLGVVYKMQGNYPLAIASYNKSLAYSKKAEDTLGIAIKLNNLGDAYKSIGKYDIALEYHLQSLALATQKENKEHIAINNGNIGNIYLLKKEYQKALDYYRNGLKSSEKINDVKNVAICRTNIGSVYLLLDKPIIARENYFAAKEISEKTELKAILASSLLGIAETYLYEENYQQALFYGEKGQQIADALQQPENQKKATELLHEIYKSTGEYKKALENHEQFKVLNDSLFNKESIEKISQLEYEYKYKQAIDSANIRELRLTKEVSTINTSLEKSQRNILLTIIAFLLTALILGAIIFSLKWRNIREKNQNILVEQKLLRSQMTPHFIFNSLSVLQGMILNKEEQKSISYLSKFSKLLRITLENSRDKLVPLVQELDAINNYMALQNLDADPPYKYDLVVAKNIDINLFHIPPMLIQPFIENAIEHAFPQEKENRMIAIHLKFENEELSCTITDNGIGVAAISQKTNANKKSLATTITNERLLLLGKEFNVPGDITITDRSTLNENGTLVTLVIPYKMKELS